VHYLTPWFQVERVYMPDVQVAKISVGNPVWLHDTYFYDMTCAGVGIWTTSNEFFEEQVCLMVLICIKERDGLKYVTN
jgi:hypothetical protein